MPTKQNKSQPHGTNETDMNKINTVLEMIKEHTGISLTPCNHFTGVMMHGNRQYFNVVLNDRVSESEEYLRLEAWANKYEKIEIAPNGLNRVAVFF